MSYNAAVTVTGITTTTSDGHQWYRIKYNGITAYVRADLLSDEKDSTVTPGSGSGSGSGEEPANISGDLVICSSATDLDLEAITEGFTALYPDVNIEIILSLIHI